jgi:Protein of unknown function (DUF3592)
MSGKDASPIFAFWYSLGVLALVAAVILWHRRYGRMWRQFRAKNWEQVSGRFDEGDIVRMKAGRSERITGYQVWFGYDYEAEGEQVGIYTLPFFGEFPDEETAERCRTKVANRAIIVRVSPRNPKRTCVLDQDVSAYFGENL